MDDHDGRGAHAVDRLLDRRPSSAAHRAARGLGVFSAHVGDRSTVRRPLAVARRARDPRVRPDQPQRPGSAAEHPAGLEGRPARAPGGDVTTGAGVAVPFAWVGELLGSPWSTSRLHPDRGSSLSGRMISPVAAPLYAPVARARQTSRGVSSPATSSPTDDPRHHRDHEQPFDRLVGAVVDCSAARGAAFVQPAPRASPGECEGSSSCGSTAWRPARGGAHRGLPCGRRLDHARSKLRAPTDDRLGAPPQEAGEHVDEHHSSCRGACTRPVLMTVVRRGRARRRTMPNTAAVPDVGAAARLAPRPVGTQRRRARCARAPRRRSPQRTRSLSLTGLARRPVASRGRRRQR